MLQPLSCSEVATFVNRLKLFFARQETARYLPVGGVDRKDSGPSGMTS